MFKSFRLKVTQGYLSWTQRTAWDLATSDSTDLSYATPVEFLLKNMEEVGFQAIRNFSVLRNGGRQSDDGAERDWIPMNGLL